MRCCLCCYGLWFNGKSVTDPPFFSCAQTGTRWDKIVLKKWYTIFKDHVTLGDYEIHDGMNLELYYQ